MKKYWNSEFALCKAATFILRFLPNRIIYRLIALTRYWEGNKGFSIRYALYKNTCDFIGKNVKFYPSLFILFPEKLRIGDNSTLHEFSILECKGEVEIGSNTSIAHKFSLLSSTHKYSLEGKSFRTMGLESKHTKIGNDVWIGAGVVVTYGVNIGDYAIIGAQTLVNKHCETFGIYGGVPVRLLKNIKP